MPDDSIKRFPRTPAAHTTVPALMNSNSSSPFLILTPSGVASTTGVPIENSIPLASNCPTAYSTSSGSNPGRYHRSCFYTKYTTFSFGTSNSLQSSGTRFPSSPRNSIPVNPAPPTTIVRRLSSFSSSS